MTTPALGCALPAGAVWPGGPAKPPVDAQIVYNDRCDDKCAGRKAGIMAEFRTVLKRAALDFLLGRFDSDASAAASLNKVSPFIYLCGAAWAGAAYVFGLGTTMDTVGGLLLIGTAAYTHWRKSIASAAVVLVYVLYLPFALAGRMESEGVLDSLLLYIPLLLCAYRAFWAAWFYQRHSS
jgi:hypothetical protein